MIDKYLVLCSYGDSIDIIGVCDTYENAYKVMKTDYLEYITGASNEDLKMSYIDTSSARGSYYKIVACGILKKFIFKKGNLLCRIK